MRKIPVVVENKLCLYGIEMFPLLLILIMISWCDSTELCLVDLVVP